MIRGQGWLVMDGGCFGAAGVLPHVECPSTRKCCCTTCYGLDDVGLLDCSCPLWITTAALGLLRTLHAAAQRFLVWVCEFGYHDISEWDGSESSEDYGRGIFLSVSRV